MFYFQGARGYDPVTAGLALAPLAIGLLVLSPISGALADRIGSRGLATAGMLITAVGLLGLTTIQVDTPYWQLAVWQLIIGAGSGLFISPNTSAVMGVVPPEKRGMAAGARMMLTQTGFVISIALSIGLVVERRWTRQVLLVDLLGHPGRRGRHRHGAVHHGAPHRVRCRRRRQPARRGRLRVARRQARSSRTTTAVRGPVAA